MKPPIIENPILNSPYDEPSRHFRFSEEGITNEVVKARRVSAYFVPIPRPKKRGAQRSLDTEWTRDRVEENAFINDVRARVREWRADGYRGVSNATRRLLEYWRNPDRNRPLFFCQLEAVETAIYLAEAAGKYGGQYILNKLEQFKKDGNSPLYRVAFKMATGSGKTVVMAMLITWQTLNRHDPSQNGKFSDAFLIVTPGITIRDRLRVLLPSDPNNYYKFMELVPPDRMGDIGQAKVAIVNFHQLKPREKESVSKVTRDVLGRKGERAFTETAGQMVSRVCRDLGNRKNIIVINDEAHHCYRHKEDGVKEKLTGDERREAQSRDEAARVWINGLEAVKKKVGVRVAYDLSATPFFLRGSGYNEGTLFPWVVSDFSLIDAIECGIVKIPRVPVADDSMVGAQPTYRDLWYRVRDDLPKKGRGTEKLSGEPVIPVELEGALHSLYGNYEKYFDKWKADAEARARGLIPPVFIVVCNNTSVSKLVYDYISGWEKDDGVVVGGKLPLFSNVADGRWMPRPNTILVDSEQLESGEAMSPAFKKIAAREIDDFKAEYRKRFPGRDVEGLTDEDLLREVMNTVGKAGKLGEQVRCVVSVAMLTEGWDANTVTHVLGVRAFGTQLLCEQVIGRALRRVGYAVDGDGKFTPQYAEVYGVPFSFIPCAGSAGTYTDTPTPRVYAMEEREACEITFPRLAGYRYDLPTERITARFTADSGMTLSTEDIPINVENAPIVGEVSIHTLEELRERRLQEVEFLVARTVLEKYFRDEEGSVKPWLFPQLLAITREWLAGHVTCKDKCFPQLLLFVENAHNAADRIYRAVVAGEGGEKRLVPILRPYDRLGSTRYVDFNTSRPTWPTREDKCHVNLVVGDTGSWEQKVAQSLEEMDEVVSYVKNDNLGFYVPYAIDGHERNYVPDFIVRINDGRGDGDLLNLIIEVTGERRPEKVVKVDTARTLWVPAVNNHGGFGRWAFLEITDPWDLQNAVRAFLAQGDY
jgi:type III restriction enzyme